MALVKEFMGCSIIQKPPFLPSNISNSINHFSLNPRRSNSGQIRRVPPALVVKAAISEDLAKFVEPEKPVTFKVRAVFTVRNKYQQDFTETLVKKIDALTDQIGRNVVLHLYSNDIDPSMLPV